MFFKSFILLTAVTSIISLNAVSIDEVLENALQINPEITEKEKRYKEIYYDVEMAKSGYLPKIDLIGTLPLRDTKNINANSNIYDLELSLTQNLFNGFGDISKYKLELSKYESAFYTTKELRNIFSLEVIRSYINLLKEKDMLSIKNSSVVNHENIFKKITIKYDAGLGNRLELRLSNTSLHLAKINYYEQKNALNQAKIAVEKYLDKEIDISTLIYPVYDIKIPENFYEALEIALKDHPSMYIAKLNKKMSDYEVEYTKKDLYPSLNFNANYYTGENGVYKSLFDEYYELNIKLSYNLYNGNYDLSAKRKIQFKLAQKIELIEKARQDISHKLKSKYDEYLMLKEKKSFLDEYVNLKGLTLESYYAEFSIGKSQLRDILDTTESLYAAKKMQLDGEYNLLLSKYNVLEAMGKLPEIEYLDTKITNLEALIDKYSDVKIEINALKDIDVVGTETKVNMQEISETKIDTKRVCYVVNANSLNIREEMSTASKILGAYINGEIICSDRSENLWVKTKNGWVFKKYLKLQAENSK